MKRLLPIVWGGSMVLAYMAGQGTAPASGVAAQQPAQTAGALPPGLHSKIRLGPDQGEPTLFAAEDLAKAHTALSKTTSGVATNPREFFNPMIARTQLADPRASARKSHRTDR